MSIFNSIGQRLQQGYLSAAAKPNHFGILSDLGQFAKGTVSGASAHVNDPHYSYEPLRSLPVPDNSAPTGGNYGGGGGSFGSGVDLSPYRNTAFGDINTINSLYDQVNGQIGAYGQDKRNQIDQNYSTQFQNNDKAYASANDTTNSAYTGRGLYDSSFRSNQLGQNKDQYDTSTTQLHQAQDQNYAQLGQELNGARASLGDKPNVDIGQYKDVNSLQDLHNQLGSYIASLRGSQDKLLTQGQLRGKLDAIAPAKSNLSDTLKATIDKLVAGGGDPAAKQGIAATYISRLPQDQKDYWNQYLQQQLQGINQPKAVA